MAAQNKKIKDILKYTLLFLLAGVLVYFAFRKVDWGDFWNGLLQTRWFWVAVFCVVSLVAVLFRAIRWRELLLPFDPDIKMIRVLDVINIGNLTSVALPGVGELLRCALVTNKKLEYDKSIGTMFCERLWDCIALTVLAIVSLLLGWNRFGSYFKGKNTGSAGSQYHILVDFGTGGDCYCNLCDIGVQAASSSQCIWQDSHLPLPHVGRFHRILKEQE